MSLPLLLGLAGCDPESARTTALVHVEGLAALAAPPRWLRVIALVDGRGPLMETALRPPSDFFSLLLPPFSTAHRVQIQIEAVDRDPDENCITGRGRGVAQDVAPRQAYLEATVPLQRLDPSECTLTLARRGPGQATLTAEQPGRDRLLLPADQSERRAYFLSDRPITVTAGPKRSAYLWEVDAPECAVVDAPCALTQKGEPRRVQYTVASKLCTAGLCWDHPLPQGNHLNAVFVEAADRIWVAGDAGTLLRYDGVTWSRIDLTTTAALRGVWSNGAGRVWVVGDAPGPGLPATQICGEFRAELGRMDFSYCLSTVELKGINLNAVHGVHTADGDQVRAVGPGGLVLLWKGTGFNDYQFTDKTRELRAVWTLSPQEHFAADSAGQLFRTTNNKDWTAVYRDPSQRSFRALAQAGGDTLWASGDGGLLVRFDRKAATPTAVALPQGATLALPALAGQDGEVLAAGYRAVYRYRLSGPDWVAAPQAPLPIDQDVRAAAFGPAGPFLVGSFGALLRPQGESFLDLTRRFTDDKLVGLFARQLPAATEPELWALAKGGRLLRGDGATWSLAGDLPGAGYNGLFGNQAQLFAVGGGGVFKEISARDGKIAVKDVVPSGPPVTESLQAGWIDDSNGGLVVGAGGILLQRSAAGWASAPRPTANDLLSVSAAAGGDLWVAGGQGAVLHGPPWQSETIMGTPLLRGIFSRGATTLAVGSQGIFSKTMFGWSNLNISCGTASVDLNGVWGGSARDVWAVGFNGALIHYTDTGCTSPQRGANQPLRGVFGLDETRLWVFGDLGLILSAQAP